LLSVFLIVAVDVLGLTIMIPLLPFYAERMGASPAQVGWLIGVYAACQLVSGPILGRWSDTLGRKPLLIASQIGTCAGFLVTAFAPNLWVLFAARAIDGLTAGNLSLATGLYLGRHQAEGRAKSFGIIGIAFGPGVPGSDRPCRACWRRIRLPAADLSPRRRCRPPAWPRRGSCCRP
jgi:MFS family permease